MEIVSVIPNPVRKLVARHLSPGLPPESSLLRRLSDLLTSRDIPPCGRSELRPYDMNPRFVVLTEEPVNAEHDGRSPPFPAVRRPLRPMEKHDS